MSRDAIERFDREVEILRGLGGMPTTADLRWRAEQVAYAALPSRAEEEAAMRAMLVDDWRMELEWTFAARHDDPQFRTVARDLVRKLKEERDGAD